MQQENVHKVVQQLHLEMQRLEMERDELTVALEAAEASAKQAAAAASTGKKESGLGKDDRTADGAMMKVKALQSRLSELKARLKSVSNEKVEKQRRLNKMRTEAARAERLEASISQLKREKIRISKRQTEREAQYKLWTRKMEQKCRKLEKRATKCKSEVAKVTRKEQQQAMHNARREQRLQRVKAELKKTKGARLLSLIKANTKQRLKSRSRWRKHSARAHSGSTASSSSSSQSGLEEFKNLVAEGIATEVRRVELQENLQLELQDLADARKSLFDSTQTSEHSTELADMLHVQVQAGEDRVNGIQAELDCMQESPIAGATDLIRDLDAHRCREMMSHLLSEVLHAESSAKRSNVYTKRLKRECAALKRQRDEAEAQLDTFMHEAQRERKSFRRNA